MPDSQYRFSTSQARISISPSPLFFMASQKTPYTPLPLLSLRHQTVEYASSNLFCSRITGSTSDNTSASFTSPFSRGSTHGSGRLSMASACLLAMQLNSHAEAGSGSSGLLFTPRITSHWRRVNHFSFSTMRLLRLSLPDLYFWSMASALATSSLPTGPMRPGAACAVSAAGVPCCGNGSCAPSVSCVLGGNFGIA